MKSLHRAVLRGTGAGGGVIPTVFPALAGRGVHFRRGELAMVAAEPGAGKSSFALHLAMQAKVPTLYVSADSDIRTQTVRMMAAITGRTQEQVEQVLSTHDLWAADQLKSQAHIEWVFDSAPSLDDIEDEVDAYITKHGEPPALLVLDNASDIDADNGDEWSSLRALMRQMKFWARYWDMSVLALHHTSEAEKGNPCPPRSSIQGKVNQVPALIITLASSEEGWMWACPVKNRHGKADKTGENASSWQFWPETMTFAVNPADLHLVG